MANRGNDYYSYGKNNSYRIHEKSCTTDSDLSHYICTKFVPVRQMITGRIQSCGKISRNSFTINICLSQSVLCLFIWDDKKFIISERVQFKNFRHEGINY